jgi:hypothetical protein
MPACGSFHLSLGQHLLQRSTCLAGRAPSWALPRLKLGYARLSFVVFGNLAATQVLLPKTLWHCRAVVDLTMPVLPAAVASTTSTSTLWGVLYGIRTVLPHIRAYGDGGHIANTASVRWTDIKSLGTANS